MGGSDLTKLEAAIYNQAVAMLGMNGIPADVGYVIMKNVCARMCESAYLLALNKPEQTTEPTEGEENGN